MTQPPDPPGESWCPKCHAGLTGEVPRCNSCGYTLEGVRLYNPKHFVWLGFLFSAMVPIYCSASNWGKVGNKRAKRLWLGLGMLGFALVTGVLIVLPENALGLSAQLVGHLLNVPIAWALRDMQRPLYGAGLALGAKKGSLLKGTLLGLCYFVIAIIPPTGALMAKYELEVRHGEQLLDEERYEEAAAVFERLLDDDPEDARALFGLGFCHSGMERWDEAAASFEQLAKRPGNEAVGYALLARVRGEQGRSAEADAAAQKAVEYDPEIFDKLGGE